MCQVALLREKIYHYNIPEESFPCFVCIGAVWGGQNGCIAYNLSPQASVNSFKAISSKSDLNMNKMWLSELKKYNSEYLSFYFFMIFSTFLRMLHDILIHTFDRFGSLK